MLQKIQKLGSMHWEKGSGICQVPLGSTGRFQISGTTSVHTVLKPRAKANPTVYSRYMTPVDGRAVGCAQSQGLVSGAQWEQGCNCAEGISFSLGMSFRGTEHQT